MNPTRPATVAVRWADDAGQQFTTGAGLFCLTFTFLAGCDPATVLGRLPANIDRGINTTPVNGFTDLVTLPTSVGNRALKLLEADPSRGQFFFVRSFTPSGGGNLGGGAGVTVFAQINVILGGSTSSGPLSLARVEMFGREPDAPRVRLVDLGAANLAHGEVVACIDYAGSGRLSGYWEVAGPTDPDLREIDRFPEASLSEEQRRQQRRFNRVERFIRQLPPSGHACIGIPYRKLPRDVPGVHLVFLHLDRSLNPSTGTTIEAGATAPFALPFLRYRVGAVLGRVGGRDLAARLVEDHDASGVRRILARWTPLADPPLVVRVSVEHRGSGEVRRLIAPIADGGADISRLIPREHALADYQVVIEALDTDGSVHSQTRAVSLAGER